MKPGRRTLLHVRLSVGLGLSAMHRRLADPQISLRGLRYNTKLSPAMDANKPTAAQDIDDNATPSGDSRLANGVRVRRFERPLNRRVFAAQRTSVAETQEDVESARCSKCCEIEL